MNYKIGDLCIGPLNKSKEISYHLYGCYIAKITFIDRGYVHYSSAWLSNLLNSSPCWNYPNTSILYLNTFKTEYRKLLDEEILLLVLQGYNLEQIK